MIWALGSLRVSSLSCARPWKGAWVKRRTHRDRRICSCSFYQQFFGVSFFESFILPCWEIKNKMTTLALGEGCADWQRRSARKARLLEDESSKTKYH